MRERYENQLTIRKGNRRVMGIRKKRGRRDQKLLGEIIERTSQNWGRGRA